MGWTQVLINPVDRPHWIFNKGNICKEPWFFPVNMEVSCKLSHPVLGKHGTELSYSAQYSLAVKWWRVWTMAKLLARQVPSPCGPSRRVVLTDLELKFHHVQLGPRGTNGEFPVFFNWKNRIPPQPWLPQQLKLRSSRFWSLPRTPPVKPRPEGRAGNQRSYQSYQSPRLLSLYQALESYQQKNITSTYSKKLL